MSELSIERVLAELRNGDTAALLARRLGEPPGHKVAHSPRRVVAALQEARRLGRVESRCDWEKDIKPVRWRHLPRPGSEFVADAVLDEIDERLHDAFVVGGGGR